MQIDIEVEVWQGPDYGKIFAWAAVAVYVLWLTGLLWWTFGAIALIVAVWQIVRMVQAAEAAKRAIVHRAELQHQQVLSGDERGVYGDGYQDWRRYRAA